MPARTAVVILLPWLAFTDASAAQVQDPRSAPLTVVGVLDASGSMWGQVEGVTKIVFAKQVLRQMVDEMPDGNEVGLIAYGHRRRGDCEDIETVVPLAPIDKTRLKAAVGALVPLGETPLARSTARAYDILGRRGPSIVLLVTDGLDTCGGDLVATVHTAREQSPNVVLYIVGFDVVSDDERQLEAAAEAGCGLYLSAKNAGGLAAALGAARTRLRAVSTMRDEFDFSDFGADKGSLVGWRFAWQETGEDDGPGDGGVVEIEADRTCFDKACLNIEADVGAEGVSVARQVNLDGVDSATLSFAYGHDGNAGSEIVLEVSGDGGINWDVIETFQLNRVVDPRPASYDLMPWASANTWFRFRVTVAEWGDLGIDDLRLDYTTPGKGGIPGIAASLRDEFTFYGGNDGNRAWTGSWVENDNDRVASGGIRLRPSPHCRAGQCLKLKTPRAVVGADVYREADLTGAAWATLTYYFEHVLIGGDEIVVEVSGDGGETYTVLETYDGDTPQPARESFDISAFAASETRVRFRITGIGRGQGMWIDDVQIEFADPGTCRRQTLAGRAPS